MSVPQDEKLKQPVGHLKALALQVLKRSVPVSQPLASGTVGHPTQESNLYDAQDSWNWIEERAAILECEAGLHRDCEPGDSAAGESLHSLLSTVNRSLSFGVAGIVHANGANG